MAIPEADSRERVESNNQYTAVTATSRESLGGAPRINYQYSFEENKNTSSYNIGVNRESLAHHLTNEANTNAISQQPVNAKGKEQTVTDAELNKTSETVNNEATGQEIFESVQEWVRRAYGEDGLRKMGLLSTEEGGEEARAEADTETIDLSEEELGTVAYEANETKTEKDPFTQRVGRVAGRLSVKATKVTSAFSTAPFRELDKTTTESPDEIGEVRLTQYEKAHSNRLVRTVGAITAAAVLAGSVEIKPSEETATEVSAIQQQSSTVNMEAAAYLSQMQEDTALSAETEEAAAEAEETVESGTESETGQNESNEQHEAAEEAPKPEITIEWIPETIRRHEPTIVKAAEKYGFSPDAIAIIMTLESAGNSNAASSADAEGLMQLWPPTRDSIMHQRGMSEANMFDPELNVDFGTGMLKGLVEKYLGTSNVVDANAMRVIAAGYNGGPGRAQEVIAHNFDIDAADLPRETRTYARLAGEMWEQRGNPESEAYNRWKKPVSEGGHNGYVLLEQAEDYWASMPAAQSDEVTTAGATEPQPQPEPQPETQQKTNKPESETAAEQDSQELGGQNGAAKESYAEEAQTDDDARGYPEVLSEPDVAPEVGEEIVNSTGNIIMQFGSTTTEGASESKENTNNTENHTAEEPEPEDVQEQKQEAEPKAEQASTSQLEPKPEPKPESEPKQEQKAEQRPATRQEYAQHILRSGNVTGDPRYMEQIEAMANGDTSCNINHYVLGALAEISNHHDIYITSLNRNCTGVLTASGTASSHYKAGGGHAFDIGSVDGVKSTGNTNKDRELLQMIDEYLPAGSKIGQNNCREVPLLIPEDTRRNLKFINDSCDHIHIEVPLEVPVQ